MDGFFSRPLIWGRLFRYFAYWAVVLVVAGLGYRLAAPLSAGELVGDIVQASRGDWTKFGTEKFAHSLAWGLGACALGVLAASLIFHTLLVCRSIGHARLLLERARSKTEFAAQYGEISETLRENPLLGHAWDGFEGTLLTSQTPIRSTVRPHHYFTLGALRERLPGLKIMSAIPGYFVGIGLLLTFVGLVLALDKAAAGAEAARAAPAVGALAAQAAGGAPAMQKALGELLQAATFKFSTSIAGLGSSIALSFFFRLFNVAVESSLAEFCRALEARLAHLTPQELTTKMVETLDSQLSELKSINSEEFFSRLGQDIGPPMREAVSSAIIPLTERLEETARRLEGRSESGLAEMLEKFKDSLQGGAGAELRELATTLKSMHAALEKAGERISGSGDEFSRRMMEAAENLSRLVADAGKNLGQSSEQSREALAQMLAALRETFEAANEKIDGNLSNAADGASARLEAAMGKVLGELEGQVGGLRDAMSGLREDAARQISDTTHKVTEAQANGVEEVTRASAEAANALKKGLADAMSEIRGEVEKFSAALRASETSLGAQRHAIDAAATRSRDAADAFEQSAQAIRAAVEPVARSNEKLAGAAQTMTDTLARSVASLNESQKAAHALAQSLETQSQRVTETWRDYQARFGKVDEDLGRAFTKLAEETYKQSEILKNHTVEVDNGLASSVGKLAQFLENFDEHSEGLSEAAEELKTTFVKIVQQLETTG